MSITEVDYHIIILGGGIVGLALANKLAPLGLKIAIIEKSSPKTLTVNQDYDLRVVAINHASESLFRDIQCWDSISNLRYSPYYKMKVWESGKSGNIEFDCQKVHTPNLGYIIEQNVIIQSLIKRLELFPTVNIIWNSEASAVKVHDEYGLLTLNNNPQYRFKLLVGADGKDSWLRHTFAIAGHEHDYQHHALITHIHCGQPHLNTAYQIFLPTGPLAFLPLADPHLCSIVWSTLPAIADTLKTLSDHEFNQTLETQFESKLGKLKKIAPLVAFPLKLQHAHHYVQARIALIGDAAHTVHPLAGLGVNLGLQDVTSLAQILEKSLHDNRDIGLMKTLKRYERERRGENLIMLSCISGFKDLFNSKLPIVGTLRNQALNFTNQTPWLKELFIRKAMGI